MQEGERERVIRVFAQRMRAREIKNWGFRFQESEGKREESEPY